MQTAATNIERQLQAALQLSRRGERGQAIALCRQALAQQPEHGMARYLLAVTLLETRQIDAGIAELQRLLAREPGHAGARYSLGRAFAAKGMASEAGQQYELAIGLYPEGIEAYVELARLRMAAGEVAGAETLLRDALGHAPQDQAALNNLAGLLGEQGRGEEAIALLRRALEAGGKLPLVHFNLAKLLRDRGQGEEALSQYRQAVAFKPDFVGAWHNMGNLLLDLEQVEEAVLAFRKAVLARRQPGAPAGPESDFGSTTRTKLQHDIEQFEYLMGRGLLPASAAETVAHYRAALAALPAAEGETHVFPLPAAQAAALAPSYNRLLHWEAGERVPAPALNPALDLAAIEADYHANAPGMTFADSLLAPEALAALRRFCLDSTFWFTYRYANGYLGALMDDGFCCPLLLQIAEELRLALPGIFKHHQLRKLWAFKYDSELSGIPIHGDFAAVNVNFWLTPDEANLDPESGGLVVWDKEAPLDWDFEAYNTDEAKLRTFVAESGARAMNVPHRQNRMVMFNSDLFHETGPLRFKPGYENRRINVTMLYGKRENA